MNFLAKQNEPGKTNALPNGWIETSLAEVAELIFGQSPPSSTYNDQGVGLPFFQGKAEFGPTFPTVRKWCSKPRKIASPNDILISVRAPVGPTNLAPCKCGIGRGLTAIRACAGVSDRYLLHYLRFVEDQLAAQATGTTFGAITSKVLSTTKIVLPNTSEQERIVSKIDELFNQIDAGEANLRRVQALVKTYRQSVLKAAVTGELTCDWREKNAGKYETGADLLKRILEARRQAWEAAELAKMKAKGKPPKGDKWKAKYKEPEPPDTSNLPELPEGWAWATLPQLGEFGRGKSKHRPRNDPKLYGGPYPFLQTGTIRRSQGRITDYDSTYNETGLAQSKLWPKGTICITIAANIAESGILEFAACFPDSVVGLFPVREVEAEYIECFIRTAREDLDRYAPATAQKNINLEILSQVAVPLPPQAEQQKINEQTQILL